MRNSAFIPALLIAASSQLMAVDNWTTTLTSESGGTQTRVSWALTGNLTYTWQYQSTLFSGPNFGGSGNNSNVGLTPFKDGAFASQKYFSINPGITITNGVTNQFGNIDSIGFFTFTYNGVTSGNISFQVSAGVPITSGGDITYGGVLNGSFVINQAFGDFNEGTWTIQNTTFDQVLVIGNGGAPIPEPSTYGLMLGGLALAVVAARRRAKRA